jgi:hypothetical protein
MRHASSKSERCTACHRPHYIDGDGGGDDDDDDDHDDDDADDGPRRPRGKKTVAESP